MSIINDIQGLKNNNEAILKFSYIILESIKHSKKNKYPINDSHIKEIIDKIVINSKENNFLLTNDVI